MPRIAELFPRGRLASIATSRPTLADVFTKITGKGLEATIVTRMVAALAGAICGGSFASPAASLASAAKPLILSAVLGAGFAGSFRPGGGAGVGYLEFSIPASWC